MKKRLSCLNAILVAAIAAVLFAAEGLRDDVAAEETQRPDSAETRVADPEPEQGAVTKTRRASCRCGQLTVAYEGPDPKRITLCHCNSCQERTGTAFSIQARFPRAKAKIAGKSTTWKFPDDKKKPVTYKSCDSGGATYHFCPVCGTTVYWDIAAAPDVIGIAIGTLTDPTFPPPKISGFEKYGHPWAMKAADLPIIRLELAEQK